MKNIVQNFKFKLSTYNILKRRDLGGDLKAAALHFILVFLLQPQRHLLILLHLEFTKVY